MPSWTTDLRHLPADALESVTSRARARTIFAREVVEAATSKPWFRGDGLSAARCPARVSRRKCGARVRVALASADLGDQGAVSGFAGSEVDLAACAPQAELVTWGFADEDRDLLTEATAGLPQLRALVARGSPDDEDPELLLVAASVSELDEMYSLIEAMMDATRSQRKLAVLDGMLASLSSSIDGF